MRHSINYELTGCQLPDDQLLVDTVYLCLMKKTMGDRIKEIKGLDSFATVSKKLAREKIVISPQGVHKWVKGGEVPESSLLVLCKIYSASPAYVRYGVKSEYPQEIIKLAEKISALPGPKRDLLIQIFEKNGVPDGEVEEKMPVTKEIKTTDYEGEDRRIENLSYRGKDRRSSGRGQPTVVASEGKVTKRTDRIRKTK